jgi:membrane-bound metal-dependent hydrolase YbcI (DUF457 family)
VPFTPFHFGPHACVSLPLHRYVDVPVFILANVVIDLEPLAVIVFNLNYPLHGYCHTLLLGGVLGLAWGAAAYPLRGLIGTAMNLVRLPYETSFAKLALSGLAGAWLHILFDSLLYHDIRPLWPSAANPLLGLLSHSTVYTLCAASFVPALILYVCVAFRGR